MLLKTEKKIITKELLRKLPLDPGVYIFLNEEEVALYVGKSASLKNRVQSYFSKNLYPKTKQMISESVYLSTIRVNSDLEALLLEAELVKKLQPRYNSQLKDDKHPLYIRITKEPYPQVLTARRIDLEKENILYFGPYPSSQNVRAVLRMLRKIYPFAQHQPGKRPCLYSQIGLCNPCPSIVENTNDMTIKKILRRKYMKNIKLISRILSGNLNSVRILQQAQMEKLAGQEKFEEAQNLRDQIRKLDYITQPITPISEFLKNPNLIDDIRRQEMSGLKNFIGNYSENLIRLNRIECYDVAHISGVNATASMVTFIGGIPDKSFYRHFRIRQIKGSDDYSSLREVAKRRKRHFNDWGVPDLIVVDGGKGQTKIFSEEMSGENIVVVGLAKRFEKLIIPIDDANFNEVIVPKGPQLNLLKRLRDEAHRFARRYHHKLMEKSLIPEDK